MRATAVAHPNIALVKYWGKRQQRLVLPHQSSVSVTLGPIAVTTSVEFTPVPGPDAVEINGRAASGTERLRVAELLTLVRREPGARCSGAARVTSSGNFPASAGLASSAAAFAALAVAARAAAGLPRQARRESILARRGSGSACRSVFGGFVRWRRGRLASGIDSYAEQLFAEDHWPDLRLVVALVSLRPKEVSSRDAMRATVETSPFYSAWVTDAERAARQILPPLRARDLQAVGELAEQNAWRMHATAMGAVPPLCYLTAQTLEVLSALPPARSRGVGVWFTLDAGPNPVLLTSAADEQRVVRLLRHLGVSKVITCAPGPGVSVSVVP